MMVLHVYAWGCRHHSVIKGFPTAFYRGVNDVWFHVSVSLHLTLKYLTSKNVAPKCLTSKLRVKM